MTTTKPGDIPGGGTREAVPAGRPVTPEAVAVSQAPARTGVSEVPAPATAPQVLGPIPDGGGRVTIDRVGDRTIITSSAVPSGVMPLAIMAQETAFGLVGLLAAIIILGPFARMFARRMDRRTEINAVGENAQVLQQQLRELQQSVDAMSLEVERISESQRFQSKLLHEKRSG